MWIFTGNLLQAIIKCIVVLIGIFMMGMCSNSNGSEPSSFDEILEEPSQIAARSAGGKLAKSKILESEINCKIQGRFGVPNECAKFQRCSRVGSIAIYAYCSHNKLFHHQKRKCLKISQDQCKASMCKSATDQFRDPYSTEQYLTCKKMIPEVEFCPEGHIYDSTDEECVKGNPLEGMKSPSAEDSSSAEVVKLKQN